MLYKTTIRPVLGYGDFVYDSCLKSEYDAIKKCPRKAALIYTGAFRHTRIDVPRPLTNDLWAFLFQTIEAESVRLEHMYMSKLL